MSRDLIPSRRTVHAHASVLSLGIPKRDHGAVALAENLHKEGMLAPLRSTFFLLILF